MGKVKNFLKNHFEKIGLGLASVIAAVILLKAFSGGQIEQIIRNIDEQRARPAWIRIRRKWRTTITIR